MDELLVEINKAADEAKTLPETALLSYLRPVLGDKLVVYCVALVDKQQLEWVADGQDQISGDQMQRLRALYEAVKIVCKLEGPEMARAWIVGRDPLLGDEAAAYCLHEGIYSAVSEAARNFVYGG